MKKHAETLRSYSIKSTESKGPSVVETAFAIAFGFGGLAYTAYGLYHLFIG